MKRYIIRVSGRVQGVFYRATTQEQANLLNIKGWIRNEADGSVLIEAEGSTASLHQLVEWCKEGPPSAQVSHVSVTEGSAIGYDNFTVRR